MQKCFDRDSDSEHRESAGSLPSVSLDTRGAVMLQLSLAAINWISSANSNDSEGEGEGECSRRECPDHHSLSLSQLLPPAALALHCTDCTVILHLSRCPAC